MTPTRVHLPLLALLAAACGEPAAAPARLPTVRRLAADAPFPVEVAAPDGRAVVLPAPPRRIVPANATLVDLVLALVPAERVCAIPDQALTWSRLAEETTAPALDTFRELDAERAIALAPDLLLISPFNVGLSGASLARAGVPVVSLPHPRDLKELLHVVDLLGALLGADAEARALRADVERRVAALRATAGPRTALRALIYTNLGGGGWAAGAGTLADEALRLAGLRNAASEVGARGDARFSFEEIVAADPDVLVVPARAGEVDGGTASVVESTPALRDVRAVARGFIVRLHPRLFSTGSHEIVTAAERIAAAVDALLSGAGRRG